MTTYNTIVKFFQDSGVFIYPSILVLALGLAIAIERFIYLSRSRSTNRKMWDDLRPLLNNGKFQQALAVAAKSEAAIAKMVSRGIHRLKTAKRREEIDAAMEEGMMEIVPRLEKRTHYLATFANVVTGRDPVPVDTFFFAGAYIGDCRQPGSSQDQLSEYDGKR